MFIIPYFVLVVRRLLIFCIILSFVEAKPNILFIAVDDLRPELGCYGSKVVHSPNIDRLASSGTVFERAYCQVPVCGASRASLMTGMYPTADRFVRYYARADQDAPEVPDIPTWLREHGYTAIGNGKIYHDWNDSKDSWDSFFRPNDFKIYHLPENVSLPKGEEPAYEAADVSDDLYSGGEMTNKVIQDLRRAKAKGSPFFITAGYAKPHLPFNAPKKYWDLYERDKIELVDNSYIPLGAPREAIHQWNELRSMYGGIPKEGALSDDLARTLMHGYYACISYTDAMIGRLLDELEELGMRHNTIVILWGDHGWQLGEHSLWCKHALFETSLHAPLIISAPSGSAGQRVQSLVEFVDIYPTLCQLAGVEIPIHVQGRSLAPLIRDPDAPFKEAIFGRYHGGESVRTDRYQYSEWTSGARMLYDHTIDPDENTNVAENPKYKEIVESHQSLLQRHRKSL